METQDSIGLSDFTNFLGSGALLRPRADTWFLLAGPFKATTSPGPQDVALYSPEFFSGSSATYWLPTAFYRLTTAQLLQACEAFDESSQPPMLWQDAELSSFTQSYNSIFARFHEGSLKKAVPIVFEHSDEVIRAPRLSAMIRAVLRTPTTLYPYGFWREGQGVLGATPEVLLGQSATKLRTMALAGTLPKSETSQRGVLLQDSKEMHEHSLVVQDIKQTLAQYGEVKTGPTMEVELPSLYHLKTEIEVSLQSTQSFDFFKASQSLHPTPALGVSPRAYGYKWMSELPEQKDRGAFGAPWALKWSEEEALCLVAIRNLQWSPKGSRIGSGCGIVEQSEIQREWRELFQKRLSVKKVLGLES